MPLELEEKINHPRLYKAFELMAAKNYLGAEVELQAGLSEAEAKGDAALAAVFYSSFGVVYKVKKDFQTAWKYYQKAEKLLPEDPALKLISAQLLLSVFSQYDTAIRRCQKVLTLAPHDPAFVHQANATMGLAYFKSGQRSKALECLQEAMNDDFEGLISAANIDLKLVEALLRKKTGLELCYNYLQKALSFSQKTKERGLEQLFRRLIEAFPS